MVHDGCNYFSFLAIVCPFIPPKTQNSKFWKKWKKHLEISSFYISLSKIMIRWCAVPEIWCVRDITVISHFGLFFTLLTPQQPKKIKILKKWKKSMDISSFYIHALKIMSRWCMVPEICCTTEGQMDRWREKVTHRGGCPT